MDNMKIYDAVRSVPANAKKTINAGRLKGMTDINPMWRIKALTEQFGACGIGWFYEIANQWTEEYAEEVVVIVNINLYIKVDGEWSKPIFGTGGSKILTKESKGFYVSDEAYKMATTDAISVACKQLGVGADVYWDKDNTKYSSQQQEAPKEEQKAQPVEPKDSSRYEEIDKELKRTGYGINSVLKTYKVETLDHLSDLQIKDFLKKIKNVADKEQ